MRPTLGRTVLFRTRGGNYTLPAVITATRETLDPKGIELGHVPPLTGFGHVHLTVFTCGTGARREDTPQDWGNSGSGTYVEHDVAPCDGDINTHASGILENPAFQAGTWAWPAREPC